MLLVRRQLLSARLFCRFRRQMSATTIAVLNENELENGQMFVFFFFFFESLVGDNVYARGSNMLIFCRKEVEFGEGGKVLLSRLGSQIHATSAFCTHYGAPLAKGVLAADGRVTW